MNSYYYPEQAKWVAKASEFLPEIKYTPVEPVSQIECVADPTVWQGVRAVNTKPVEEAFKESFFFYKTFRFDFGKHLVGRIELDLELSSFNDAPIRVRAKFAETPYELATDFATYHGHLDKSWLQEEVKLFDDPVTTVKFERRYAFRYLEIELGSPNYFTRLTGIRCTAESSAQTLLPPPAELTESELAIDKVSAATMHDCMQLVFEDGPKRDRRLWLGDLWQQAKVNAFTYRQFDLLEHSLYVLAEYCDEEGIIPGAAFVHDKITARSCMTMTYALLLGPVLKDHLEFSGRVEICRDLLPAALRQLEYFDQYIDAEGVLHPKKGWWLFIDHFDPLINETPALGQYVYCLRETAELLNMLGEPGAEKLTARADELSALLRKRLWLPDRKMLVSDGEERQISWATQAWMILGGVVTGEQAEAVWDAARAAQDIVQPTTPFLWSIIALAGLKIGRNADVRKIIDEYWGGMVRRGADTFWEIYLPEDPLFSSYEDPLMNSCCHAWSCFPGYLLRAIYQHK